MSKRYRTFARGFVASIAAIELVVANSGEWNKLTATNATIGSITVFANNKGKKLNDKK